MHSPARKRPPRTSRFQLESLETRLALSTADPTMPVLDPVTPVAAETSTNQNQNGVVVDPSIYETTVADLAATTGFNRDDAADPTPLRVQNASVVTRGNRVVGIALKFSESLAEQPALDTRNYRVFEVSKPNKYLARLLFQDNDTQLRNLPIRTAAYLDDHHTVVLVLRNTRKLDSKFRIGLANPSERHRVRSGEEPLATLTDTSGNPLSVPVTRRGLARRGPITVRPTSRLRLDKDPDSPLTGVWTA